VFIDLFAGCGGLSLGLMSAGWRGLLAVEKDPLAFETLKHNLIDSESRMLRYAWPSWFPKASIEISEFIERHESDLPGLGRIDLIAGGPPCQGFSMAGRRESSDPRNRLFRHYVTLVTRLMPALLLLENVRGVSVGFRKRIGRKEKLQRPFSDRILSSLEAAGYRVFPRMVRAVDVGVPQYRPRYIIIAIRADLLDESSSFDPFAGFSSARDHFLERKGLLPERPITVRQAISDLEIRGKKLIECVDSKGFKQIKYDYPRTHYQRLLHKPLNGEAPNSLRLANHRAETTARFQGILETCRQGVQMSDSDRSRFGLKKHCLVPLSGEMPSHTLTTLPDDFLHYSEPRILTVREYARLQSFPDWFSFRGKYTTGGERRRVECPRYTQVGNAVPPFLGEFIGEILFALMERIRQEGRIT
jgi:DNA (cytosine-5)-methyltransferase 1